MREPEDIGASEHDAAMARVEDRIDRVDRSLWRVRCLGAATTTVFVLIQIPRAILLAFTDRHSPARAIGEDAILMLGVCTLVVGGLVWVLAKRTAALTDRLLSGVDKDGRPLLLTVALSGCSTARQRVQRRLAATMSAWPAARANAFGSAAAKRVRDLVEEASYPGRWRRYDPAMLKAAVHVLRTVKDLDSYSALKQLARQAKGTEVGREAQWAAEELRPLAEKKGRIGGLLRPADGAAAELLRPAGGATEADVLLRASDHGEQDAISQSQER